MYNDKTIEDVVKYLYKQEKDDLARAVIDIISRLGRLEGELNTRLNHTQTLPVITLTPEERQNPLDPPYRITC